MYLYLPYSFMVVWEESLNPNAKIASVSLVWWLGGLVVWSVVRVVWWSGLVVWWSGSLGGEPQPERQDCLGQ